MGISPIRKKKEGRREGKEQARKVVNRKDILKQSGKTPISVLSAIWTHNLTFSFPV